MMYEGLKREVLRKVEKAIDKEINDSRSWAMEKTIYIEGIERCPSVDKVVLAYLQKQKDGYTTQGYEYKSIRHPSKRLVELFDTNYLRKETPRHILKANLLYRYWHHYFKKYYNIILDEVK